MKILDLFSGTGSSTQAFEDAGHEVIRVDMTQFDNTDILMDMRVFATNPELFLDYIELDWRPDVIWASPPCQGFTVCQIGNMWNHDHTPKHPTSELGLEVLRSLMTIIERLQPKFFWVENPRGKMRRIFEKEWPDYPRATVHYCQYGETRMKPTDLWGVWPEAWTPRPVCKPRSDCHESAPRGSHDSGVQGQSDATVRSMVPYELSKELLIACETELSWDDPQTPTS